MPRVTGSRAAGDIGTHRYGVAPMSTRKLILLSLACGLAILAAFTLQLLLARG